MAEILKILDFYFNINKQKNYEGLFYITLFILFIWLFKEFRKSKVDSDIANVQRINVALEIYGKALLAIQKYKEHIIELTVLYESLYAIYPYAHRGIINSIQEFMNHPSHDNISNVKKLLDEEINRLKSLQHDDVSFKFSNSIFDIFSYYYNKNNFSTLVRPLINTFIVVVSIMFFLFLIFSFMASSATMKVTVIILIFIIMIYMFLVMITLEIIFNNKFNLTFYNCLAVAVLLLLPFIFYIQSTWFIVILYASYVSIYIIFVLKNLRKKVNV